MINEYSQFILILKASKHVISVNICFLDYGNPEKKSIAFISCNIYLLYMRRVLSVMEREIHKYDMKMWSSFCFQYQGERGYY